jgi:hypothetical protein
MIRQIGEADVLSAEVRPPHIASFPKQLPRIGHIQGSFFQMLTRL